MSVSWAPILIAGGGIAAVAIAGGLLTRLGPWYRDLQKPSWQPPDWLFGPAWTVIFILEAIAAVTGWHAARGGMAAAWLIATFTANGLLNMYWSYLFFWRRRPDLAFREVFFLWASVLAMILVIANVAGPAWLYLLPYLLWVSFAAYLNLTIIRLNAPFGATP